MYFVRLDYIYKCSPVQRVRFLVRNVGEFFKAVRSYIGDDYMILSVRMERCN